MLAQSPLTYTLVVTNDGPGVASAVRVTDTLPASGLRFGSVAATQGTCARSGNLVSCDLGRMNPDTAIVVTIHVTPTVVGTLTDTAVVTGTYDPVTTRNTITGTTASVYNGANPTLTPVREGAALPGQSIIYTHTLTNTGNVT